MQHRNLQTGSSINHGFQHNKTSTQNSAVLHAAAHMQHRLQLAHLRSELVHQPALQLPLHVQQLPPPVLHSDTHAGVACLKLSSCLARHALEKPDAPAAAAAKCTAAAAAGPADDGKANAWQLRRRLRDLQVRPAHTIHWPCGTQMQACNCPNCTSQPAIKSQPASNESLASARLHKVPHNVGQQAQQPVRHWLLGHHKMAKRRPLQQGNQQGSVIGGRHVLASQEARRQGPCGSGDSGACLAALPLLRCSRVGSRLLRCVGIRWRLRVCCRGHSVSAVDSPCQRRWRGAACGVRNVSSMLNLALGRAWDLVHAA